MVFNKLLVSNLLPKLTIAMVVSFTSTSLLIAQEEGLLEGSIPLSPEAEEYTFRQGFPVGDTASAVYRNTDLNRAIEA